MSRLYGSGNEIVYEESPGITERKSSCKIEMELDKGC